MHVQSLGLDPPLWGDQFNDTIRAMDCGRNGFHLVPDAIMPTAQAGQWVSQGLSVDPIDETMKQI